MSTKEQNGQGLTPKVDRVEQGLTPDKQRKEGSGSSEVADVLREQVSDLKERVQSLEGDKEASQKREQELLDVIRQQQKTIEHQQTLLLPAPSEAGEDTATSKSQKSASGKKPGFFGRVFAWN